MLIGQLAKRTGTSERLLRYYERVGLLTSSRRSNGYRDFEDAAEQTIRQIRALLAAGLPTRLIKRVLPCADATGSLRPCPGVLDALRAQLDLLDQRAADVEQARQTLQRAIVTAERAGSSDQARSSDRLAQLQPLVEPHPSHT